MEFLQEDSTRRYGDGSESVEGTSGGMMHDADVAIRVSNLSKCFKIYNNPRAMLWELLTGRKKHKEFWALRDINFEVKKGEVVGVLGRNGAGKSTLLKILTGVLNKTTGDVQINGKISSILELGTGFHPEYTGRENILMGGMCLGMSEEEVRAKLDSIIEFSELGKVIDQPFRTYSSGMQARLTFSVAVGVEPDIFIVDEALAVGDMLFQEKCFHRIRDITKSGATVFFVTHSLSSVYELCSSAILLDCGRLLLQDAPRTTGYAYEKLLMEEKNASQSDFSVSAISIPTDYGVDDMVTVNQMICLGEDGRPVTTLLYGRRYTLRAFCTFHQDCANVNLSYRFQTLSGLAVTGVNTIFEDNPSARMFDAFKGETYQIDIQFECRLSDGQYMLGGGLAHFPNFNYLKNFTILKIVRDVLLLTVTGNPYNVGFFPLPQQTSIHQADPPNIPQADPLEACLGKVFFLFGCARSGTTSLCTLFAQAANAVCLVEPSPNLNRESRLYIDGLLADPEESLKTAILPRAVKHLAEVPLYGEKNVTLFPFAEKLYQIFQAKNIYITRDGRECVASMRRWHQEMFGNLYREGLEQPPLHPRAQAVLDTLPVEADESDYSRPRPLPGDPYFERWPHMTHHEMLCWYWNTCNMKALDLLESIPPTHWRRVDYSASDLPDQILAATEFLGLEGFSRSVIEDHLHKRINSVEQRTGETASSAGWRAWSDRELDQFWAICAPAMMRLGYYVPADNFGRRWTSDYGTWWSSQDAGPDFFAHVYQDRRQQHEALMAWARPLIKANLIQSVLEVACGHSLGYADFFSGLKYTGVDIAPKVIDWCRATYHNNRHNWRCMDFIQQPLADSYDLVFSQGTMENFYDMDAALRRMAEVAKTYIYLTGFLGYYKDIPEHHYIWNEAYKSYSNKFSLMRAKVVLRESGFSEVSCERVRRHDGKEEFLLIAKR